LLSGDPFLCAAYAPDQPKRDLHAEMAVFVEGPEVVNTPGFGSDDNRIDRRQWYKQANFLTLYRGGARKLMEVLLKRDGPLLSLDDAQRIIAGVRRQWVGLWNWQSDLIERVRRTGYMTLPFTAHARHIDLTSADSENRTHNEKIVCNFPVQCIAANTMLRIQSLLADRLPPPVHLCLNTYDAILLDCPSPASAQAARAAFEEVVHHVRTADYWNLLCQHYQRPIVLAYGVAEMRH
jgi:DNA polymerase I-like protein with 3'-5' exonuclease and polymerase domains